jgi:hypothetical protein
VVADLRAGRTLKGEKPADFPILRGTKFEQVINLQTAKALDIDIPPDPARPRRRGDRIKKRKGGQDEISPPTVPASGSGRRRSAGRTVRARTWAGHDYPD